MNNTDVTYAGFWIRGLAGSIDCIFFIILAVLCFLFSNNLLGYYIYNFIGLLYYVVLESSKYQGSLGKIIIGLKVINLGGAKISFSKAVIRYIAFMLPAIPFAWVSTLSYNPELIAASQSYYQNPQAQMNSPVLVSYGIKYMASLLFLVIFSFIWYLPIAFTKQKTGLHDLLSKTRVIRVKVFK